MKQTIVHKYGGSSVSNPKKIKAIANHIKDIYSKDKNIIIVISAMGTTTNELSDLAYKVSNRPNRRELDMLLSTGERVASALMSMALNEIGIDAISFTGSQAGILTNKTHNNARIIDVKPIRLIEELNKNKVVVLAGFQGVDPLTKEITTLGRGGTDTTAIALAHFFKAEICEMYKDVDGIFSADPKIVPEARYIKNLNYEQLMDMTFWGAKVLHFRAVELAKKLNIKINIKNSNYIGDGSMISNSSDYESSSALAINSQQNVFCLSTKENKSNKAMCELYTDLKEKEIPSPQILAASSDNSKSYIYFCGPLESLSAIKSLCDSIDKYEFIDDGLASVSLTCEGLVASSLAYQITKVLHDSQIDSIETILSPTTISFIIKEKDRQNAILSLHKLIDKK